MASGELAGILPLVLGSGAGGLGWWRIRGTNLASTPAGEALQQAYRLHSLRVALKEDDTRTAIATLRLAGVEPILLKGWAVGRSYPERGLRPYGDIDLLIRLEEFETATRVLTSSPRLNTTVELHPELGGLEESVTSEMFDRSLLAGMDAFSVRVLSHEDQLRYLCLHMLKHGARRPLQLVDIGLLLEKVPPAFDWDYCFRGSDRQSERVVCAIKLAQDILGAKPLAPPAGLRGGKLPDWLVQDVLHQWSIGMRRYNTHFAEYYLQTPRELHRAVVERWPSALEATVWSGAPINHLPRLPLQLLEFLFRTVAFLPCAMLRLSRGFLRSGTRDARQNAAVKVSSAHTALYGERPWDSL